MMELLGESGIVSPCVVRKSICSFLKHHLGIYEREKESAIGGRCDLARIDIVARESSTTHFFMYTISPFITHLSKS